MEHMTRYKGINLYIKNLEDDIDEERLRKEFSAFGQIRSAKIMSDDKGNSKGFGFICYSTPEEAQHAINEMNSRILQGCQKPLYVALHEPKEVRRQKLAQRHANRTKHMRPNLSNVSVPPGVFGAPPVYYPAPGGNQFVYQQPPQPQMVPRQPTRGPWPNQQPQQYPMQTGGPPQYVQSRPNRGRGGGQSGGGGGRGGRSNNRRNTPSGAGGQEAVGLVPGELSLQQLDAYPPDQQKLLLGERLYPLIHKVQSTLAGKITGMLLDSGWSIEELFSLLNDEEKLSVKIEEAVSVLNRAQQQEHEANEYRGHPTDAPDTH